jgi:tetratricopeptide (TPR) repeat protein
MGAEALLAGGEYRELQVRIEEAMGRLRAIQPEGKLQHDLKDRFLGFGHALIARTKYRAGDYPSAEAAAREALALWSPMTTLSLRDELGLNELRTELAMSVARQGRLKEADELIQPVLGFHHKLQQRRVDDKVQQVLLSKALFASSLAAPRERAAQLAEAATIMDGLSPEMKRWKAHALLRDEMAAEQKKRL